MKLVTIASPQPHPGALIEGEVLDFPAAPDELGYASIAALLAGAESAMSLAKALVERVGRRLGLVHRRREGGGAAQGRARRLMKGRDCDR